MDILIKHFVTRYYLSRKMGQGLTPEHAPVPHNRLYTISQLIIGNYIHIP